MVKGWGMKANIFNNVWHKLYKWRISPRPIGLGPDMKQLESLLTAWFHWYFRSFLTSSKLKFHSWSNLSLESLKFAWKSPGTTAFQEIAPGQIFEQNISGPNCWGIFWGNVHPSFFSNQTWNIMNHPRVACSPLDNGITASLLLRLRYCSFSTLLGEMIEYDYIWYFSDWLKPPARKGVAPCNKKLTESPFDPWESLLDHLLS